MDITTLAAARAYTDKKVAEGGSTPSANNVIDLTKYKLADGRSFNDVIFSLFITQENFFQEDYSGSFWSDISKTTLPIFIVDISLLNEGFSVVVPFKSITREFGQITQIAVAFEEKVGQSTTKVTIEFRYVYDGVNDKERIDITLYVEVV